MKLLSAVAVSVFFINSAQAQKAQSNGSLAQVEDTPSLSRTDFLSGISGDARMTSGQSAVFRFTSTDQDGTVFHPSNDEVPPLPTWL